MLSCLSLLLAVTTIAQDSVAPAAPRARKPRRTPIVSIAPMTIEPMTAITPMTAIAPMTAIGPMTAIAPMTIVIRAVRARAASRSTKSRRCRCWRPVPRHPSSPRRRCPRRCSRP